MGEHGPRPLVLTTNLDPALEHAFAEAAVETDVVSYIARGRHQGRFLHLAGEQATVVEIPNAYTGIPLDERAVILRLGPGRSIASPIAGGRALR